MLVGAVDTAWGSPFSPLGRQIPAAQGSAQNRRAEGAVKGLAAPQSPSGYPAPPRLECQPLCLAEVPQEPGHRCQGLVAGIPWGARFSPGAASCQLCLCLYPSPCSPWGSGPASWALPSLALRPILVTPPPPARSPSTRPCWGSRHGLHAIDCPRLCLQPSGGPLPRFPGRFGALLNPQSHPQAARL